MKNNDTIDKLAEMIQGIEIAMMTTVDQSGILRSRPMATQKTPFDGTLWFFTYADSPKADEIQKDQRINLSYADPKTNRYLSVSGSSRLVRDRKKAEEIWNPLLKTWFPNGLDDPKLALLAVKVDHAEYWETKSSALVHAFGLARALATGKSGEDLGKNVKLDLTG